MAPVTGNLYSGTFTITNVMYSTSLATLQDKTQGTLVTVSNSSSKDEQKVSADMIVFYNAVLRSISQWILSDQGNHVTFTVENKKQSNYANVGTSSKKTEPVKGYSTSQVFTIKETGTPGRYTCVYICSTKPF